MVNEVQNPTHVETTPFEEWAILELMGHRKLGGKVSEATVGGIPFLRIDVYRGDEVKVTQFYGKAAVFCMTMVDEATAKSLSHWSAPVSRYEMDPRLLAKSTQEVEIIADDQEGEDGFEEVF